MKNLPKTWKIVRFKDIFDRVNDRNSENNTNVLTISAQYGLISQTDFFTKIVASENKKNYYLIGKGDFAYNKSYSKGYPFGAFKRLNRYEKGIVSPLYICFRVKNGICPEYYEQYFESRYFDKEILAIAQEGARNHGLLNMSINDFFNTKLPFPPVEEQIKIAKILDLWDRVIELKEEFIQSKLDLKKSIVQKLFSGSYQMKKIRLSELLIEKKLKYTGDEEVFSVSVHKGLINQIEHLGRSYSARELGNYNLVQYGDIVYTKSPTGSFPYGIVKQSYEKSNVIVSPLYGIFKPIDFNSGYLLDTYFGNEINTRNFLKPIIYKGAKNTINITNSTFLTGKFGFPSKTDDINSFVKCIITINDNIAYLTEELQQIKIQKNGLMQQLLTGKIRVQC